jgi:hypothetical protein
VLSRKDVMPSGPVSVYVAPSLVAGLGERHCSYRSDVTYVHSAHCGIANWRVKRAFSA